MNDFQLEQFVRSMLRDSSKTMTTEVMLLYLWHDHGLKLTVQRVRDMRIRVLAEMQYDEAVSRRVS